MPLTAPTRTSGQPEWEVLVIGAGVCGIYMLHRMLELGVRVTVVESGDGPGGTWYWNRYPGARFDSESYTYGYSFSKELLQDWSWSEHFAAQPETLRYLNHVIDRFGLRRHMQFGCRVESATFDEACRLWRVRLSDGRTLTTRFLVTAVGLLSAATLPRIEGIDTFEGEAHHTYYWPHEPVRLEGRKVAVVGTGATAVQVIPAIAGKVDTLTVFQRRPNWCAPLHNSPIDPETQKRIKASYDEIFARCRETPGAFLHGPDRRGYADVPEAERLRFWEELYASPGFGVWLGNFREVLLDPEVNAEYSRFIASKIRQRVKDPVVAEKLIPKDHGFGTRRVPLETKYYETYNRENVTLVDISETPIERITPKGIRTTEREYEVDLIVFATGFDAITGSFDRIDITGRSGRTLREKWHEGPITYLGLSVAGFPNLLTLAGPQSASVGTNYPRGIEDVVDWATGLVESLRAQGRTLFEATPEAEEAWTTHVKSFYDGGMVARTKSWFTGYNSNVEGHDTLRYMVYFGGAPKYREILREVAADRYRGFEIA